MSAVEEWGTEFDETTVLPAPPLGVALGGGGEGAGSVGGAAAPPGDVVDELTRERFESLSRRSQDSLTFWLTEQTGRSELVAATLLVELVVSPDGGWWVGVTYAADVLAAARRWSGRVLPLLVRTAWFSISGRPSCWPSPEPGDRLPDPEGD